MMSKLTLRVFAVAGLLLASVFAAFAESDYVLRVHVPFQFMVGQTSMPAGDYMIQQDGLSGVVTLANRVAKSSVAVISVNGDVSLHGKEPHLLFRRVNGRAVLTQIQLTGEPARMMPTSFASSSPR